MSEELAGKLVSIKISGNPTDLTGSALEHVTNTQWQIENEAFRVIDLNTDPVLERFVDPDWIPVEYKSVDRLSGIFTFEAPGYDNTEMIRINSGFYLPMTVAAYAHTYSYNRGAELHQVPRFLADYMKRIRGVKFASGSLSQWDVTDTYFEDALKAGNPVVLEIRATETGQPKRVWAMLENEELSAALDSPQDLAVSFVSTGKMLNI